MADRQIGLGTIVKVDHDADTTYTTIACAKEATPPNQVRVEVDATCFEDTVVQMLPGIEDESEFSFLQVWDPTDTNHLIIDALFTSKTAVNWQVIYPFATPITEIFAGRVVGLTPETISNDSVISRTVMVRRTGSISRS
jgi:hypothetical protein